MKDSERGRERLEKVVFLDRDGTINEEVHYLHKPEDLHFLDGVSQAVRMLRQAGFKLVVITNQAGVARGYYTCKDVERLHEYMNEQLKKREPGLMRFTTARTIPFMEWASINRFAIAANRKLGCLRWRKSVFCGEIPFLYDWR